MFNSYLCNSGWTGEINNSDCAVATGWTYLNTFEAFMWNKYEGTIALNDYIDTNNTFYLAFAYAINDVGQIACWGSSSEKAGITLRLDPIFPKLDIKYEITNVVVSWLPNWPGLFLEQADSLGTTNWTAVSQSGTNVIILPKTDKQQFFRLNIQAGRGLFWGP